MNNVKIKMISAANSALSYLNKNPNADTEEVIKHIIHHAKANKGRKIAEIAAANYVLKYKEKNPKATEKQAMQNLLNNINKILESIQEQDETEKMHCV